MLKSACNTHSVHIDSKNVKLAANKKELQEKQENKRKAEEAKELENKKRKMLKEAVEKADLLQDEINALRGRRRTT